MNTSQRFVPLVRLAFWSYVLPTLILLVPVAINGFMFVYPDSGSYLNAFRSRQSWYLIDRPIFYSAFVSLQIKALPIATVAVFQSLAIVVIANLYLRVVLKVRSDYGCALLMSAMAALTPLVFFSGFIMPDVFTGFMILAMAVLLFVPVLSRAWRIVLCIMMVMSITFHTGNIAIAFALFLLGVIGFFVRPWSTGPSIGRLMLVLASFLVGVGLVVSANVIALGKATTAPGSSVFLLARLIEDGPGMAVLRDECPAQKWIVCRSVPFLEAHLLDPVTDDVMQASLADYFLWTTLKDTGWPTSVALGINDEASVIVRRALQRDPWGTAKAGLRNSVLQLGTFEVGPDHRAFAYPELMKAIEAVGGPAALKAYQASLQARGVLPFSALSAIYAGVTLVALGLLVVFMVRGVTDVPEARVIIVFIVAALLLNAAVTGGLSGVHDRYQARVIWLLPFLAFLLLLRTVTGTRQGER